MTHELLTPKQLAERYQVSIHTLQYWRDNGAGPHWIKVGRHIRYRLEDVLAYEARPTGRDLDTTVDLDALTPEG